MRNTILCLALLAGCTEAPIEARIAELETAPISGLPSYASGKVLHPWYFGRSDGERFPQPSPGTAVDPLCFLGDTYFRDCLIYECAPDLSCPGRSRCVDAAFVFDPEGSQSGNDTSGTFFYESPAGDRYYTLHDAVCVGK